MILNTLKTRSEPTGERGIYSVDQYGNYYITNILRGVRGWGGVDVNLANTGHLKDVSVGIMSSGKVILTNITEGRASIDGVIFAQEPPTYRAISVRGECQRCLTPDLCTCEDPDCADGDSSIEFIECHSCGGQVVEDPCTCSSAQEFTIPIPHVLYRLGFSYDKRTHSGSSYLRSIHFMNGPFQNLYTRLYKATLPNVYGNPMGEVCLDGNVGEFRLSEDFFEYLTLTSTNAAIASFWGSRFNNDIPSTLYSVPASYLSSGGLFEVLRVWSKLTIEDLHALPLHQSGTFWDIHGDLCGENLTQTGPSSLRDFLSSTSGRNIAYEYLDSLAPTE